METRNRTYAPGGRNVNVGRTRGLPGDGRSAAEGRRGVQHRRAFTTDFLGWLDDFSTTGGGFDALGAMGRATISFAETIGFNNGTSRR